MYKRFHDKGLDIFSVSVDTDTKKCKAAIVRDKMGWLNDFDLKGQANGAAPDFKIVAIPRCILISRGIEKIILNGDAILEYVENKLKELLGGSNRAEFCFYRDYKASKTTNMLTSGKNIG